MEPTHLKHIGAMIRKTRIYRNMTLLEVSEVVGISRGELSRIESGQRNCTINTLVRIASSLNCTLDVLLRPQ